MKTTRPTLHRRITCWVECRLLILADYFLDRADRVANYRTHHCPLPFDPDEPLLNHVLREEAHRIAPKIKAHRIASPSPFLKMGDAGKWPNQLSDPIELPLPPTDHDQKPI